MTITDDQAQWFTQAFNALVANVEQAVLGKQHVIRLVLTATVTGGHVLLEDMPGTGKTSLARALAQSFSGTSNRIQFTPDLLPGDVTGMTVYDQRTGEFSFHHGPIFANIVLADEINRASPKTQSALLEVMEEGNVTFDGVTHPVGEPFIVLATQNPIEQAGTYRLPEAQLDRFMLKTSIGYPDRAATVRILQGGSVRTGVQPVTEPSSLVTMRELAARVAIDPSVVDYIARLIEATRLAAQVRVGSSVRGALALTRGAQAWAVAQGRTYVVPDDVKALAQPVLGHRIVLEPEAEFDGVTAQAVVDQILLDVPSPTIRA